VESNQSLVLPLGIPKATESLKESILHWGGHATNDDLSGTDLFADMQHALDAIAWAI
jgi:hypothetical protein